MRWSTTLWALAVLIAWTVTILHARDNNQDLFILPDTLNDGSADDVVVSGSGERDTENGSGVGPDDIDSIEGSGVTPSGRGTPKVVTPAVTPGRQLTACQQQRLSTPNFRTSYIPTCTATGKFEKQQCKGDAMCWCVNQMGIQVEGTSKIGDMKNPRERPDCEGGSNLQPCVTLLVKSLWEFGEANVGTPHPKCAKDGKYEPMQCQGSECWCVDKFGRTISGSAKMLPDAPDCTNRTPVSYRPPIKLPTVTDDITVVDVTSKPGKPLPDGPTDPDDLFDVDGNDPTKDIPNDTNLGQTKDDDPRGSSIPLIEQPGILAGIIGGAVVGLLCAILLIMFIVYRIRKKDEGSYALDEPTKARGAYAYQKAPDKEFYA